MTAPAALVSVEEYLHGSYEPDVDFVDGQLEDRHVGELDHSNLQTEIAFYFRSRRRECKCFVVVEQRVQVSPTRYRVPDVCVVMGSTPKDQIFRTPPFVCIEILSPEDRMSRMRRKITDYLNFGVAYVWVIDPESRTGQVYTADGMHEPKDGILTTSNANIRLSLPDIFAAIDEQAADQR